MWDEVKIKQILLITDGCSNMGDDPVRVAETAPQNQIAINVIGIIDSGSLGAKGAREVQAIATAGGGMSRIVEMKHLAQTMQMMTRHTMQLTIQQAVNKELKSIVGNELVDLRPDQRMEIANVIDKAGEEAQLLLVLLIDVSASMKEKLFKVREAIRDLEIGLESRKGKHQIAIMTYPAGGQVAKVVSRFCENPGLTVISSELTASGGTPTGPALDCALDLLLEEKEHSHADAKSYVV